MSDAKVRIGQFTFNEPLVAFNVNLLEARAFRDDRGKVKGEPKYGLSVLIDPDSAELKAANSVVAAVARAAFPGVPLSKIQSPFKSGSKQNERRKAKDKAPLEYQEGKVILTARSNTQPRLSGWDGKSVVDFLSEDAIRAHSKLFYSGVHVLIQVNFVAYGSAADVDETGPDASRPGVTCYINHVFSTGRGERLGGGASAAEVFRNYVGHAMDTDPTAGSPLGDDDVPF
jgi:hypothetical protein